MLNKNEWQPINNNSTGYVGRHRNEEWRKRDNLYGRGHWQIAWLVDGKLLDYCEVCQLYEDAYYTYFKVRPELLEYLITAAAEVYDDSKENIKSGFDYHKRGKVRTHIQDIAIRNCLRRFRRKFQGHELIQIRDRLGMHPLSLALSPGQVPFHKPKLFSYPDNLIHMHKHAWWLPGSVEDFYQRAKRLCIKK